MITRDNGMISIDGEKLRLEIVKKVTKPSVMARELGFSDAYFTKVCNKGRIRKSTLVMLEEKYGIKYDDIKPDPVVEECQEPEQEEPKIETIVQETIDYDAIEFSVRRGVRSGIIDVLISAYSRMTLTDILKNAYKQAIRENLKERLSENSGKLR